MNPERALGILLLVLANVVLVILIVFLVQEMF